MALLDYKSSLAQYQRYLAAVQEQPLLRQGLWLVLSLILIIVLLMAALKPTLVTIATLLGDIRQKGGIEEKLDAKIAAITTAQVEYLKSEFRFQVLDEALPIGKKYAVWAERIEKLATDSGVVVGTWILTDGSNFTISATGDFPKLEQFLGTLENLRRLMEIESAQLNKGEQLTLTVKGSIKSYEEKQD